MENILTDVDLLRFIAKPEERDDVLNKWRTSPMGDGNDFSFPDLGMAFRMGLGISSGMISIEESMNILADELRLMLIAELSAISGTISSADGSIPGWDIGDTM